MKRILALVCLFVASVAFAQEDRGRVNGLVTDASGAVIPKAQVTLTNEATSVVRTAVSDSAGAYNFEFVIPGVYSATASSAGFKQAQVAHFRIEVAQQKAVNLKLPVGDVSETVSVTESGETVVCFRKR